MMLNTAYPVASFIVAGAALTWGLVPQQPVNFARPSSQTPRAPTFHCGVSAVVTSVVQPDEGWMARYEPRTKLGQRLLALRRAYVAGGGELLSAEQIEQALRERRGSVASA